MANITQEAYRLRRADYYRHATDYKAPARIGVNGYYTLQGDEQKAPSVDAEGVEGLEMGRQYPLPSQLGYGKHRRLPSWVWGGAPAEIAFCTI